MLFDILAEPDIRNISNLDYFKPTDLVKLNAEVYRGLMGFLQRVRIARNADRCTVRPSVRPSVAIVQRNEDTIVRFSASGKKILLVLER